MAAALDGTVLKQGKGDDRSLPASALWAEGPALIVVLRRPGCLLCREQAINIWNAREQLAAAGIKRLAVVVHEWIDREIDAFAPQFFGSREDVFWDQDKRFYAVVHGGAPRRGSLLSLANPFGAAWGNMRRAKKAGTATGNYVGDGLTLGGLLIVDRDGRIAYRYPESDFGDHAPLAEVLAAAASLNKT